MKKLRVLVGCEFSGIVRDAFAARGHDAWSCDLLPTERPGNHIQGDVLEILNDGWDMMIAHPPCTHLCSSGAQYWPEKQDGRQQGAMNFFISLIVAPIKKIAVENPVGIMSRAFGKPDQILHPFQFGDPYLKKTCLWLINLSPLVNVGVVKPTAHWHGGSRRCGPGKDGNRTPARLPTMLKYGWRERSRTFPGIADAMASQWE